MDRLRAMELFLSISQTRNFSETARRFGISATGVSRMITEIEDELKVKLLLRSTRQVALTESGQEYARELEGILWRINELQANITAISFVVFSTSEIDGLVDGESARLKVDRVGSDAADTMTGDAQLLAIELQEV